VRVFLAQVKIIALATVVALLLVAIYWLPDSPDRATALAYVMSGCLFVVIVAATIEMRHMPKRGMPEEIVDRRQGERRGKDRRRSDRRKK
jgi:uncharacterized MnhB-related membrane protein